MNTLASPPRRASTSRRTAVVAVLAATAAGLAITLAAISGPAYASSPIDAPTPSAPDGGCPTGYYFDGVGTCDPNGSAHTGGAAPTGSTINLAPPPEDVSTTTTAQARPTVKVSVVSTATAWVGSPVSVVASARDSQWLPLRFSARNLPKGLSLNPTSGAITGRPTQASRLTSTITASDNYGGTGTAYVSWTVREHKLVAKPHVSGVHKVGHTLTAVHGAFHRDSATGPKVSGVKVAYRWSVGAKAVGTRSTLRVSSRYRHRTVSVRITATKRYMVRYVRTIKVKIK